MDKASLVNGGPESAAPLKLLIEITPVGLFFLVLATVGIFPATYTLMASEAVAVCAAYILLKRVPPSMILTLLSVLIFGSLTLYFRDPIFIKIKVTIINLSFALILAAGLYLKRPFLKILLGELFKMSDMGWRILTYRWAGFFVGIAILNEIVWRNFSDSTWGAFKLFGVIGLTMAFMMSQIGLIAEYPLDEPSPDTPDTLHS